MIWVEGSSKHFASMSMKKNLIDPVNEPLHRNSHLVDPALRCGLPAVLRLRAASGHTCLPVLLSLSMTLFEVNMSVQGLGEQMHISKITAFPLMSSCK